MNKWRIFSSLVVLVLCSIFGQAGAQVAPAEREVLVDFYHATGGDDWHRNDGWLDDEVEACDWYGVDCQFRHELNRKVLRRIELPDNNLTGDLDTRIFEIVHSALDLANNRIGGVLDRLPSSPGQVDLSNNRLAGALPSEFASTAHETTGSSLPDSIWYLDLSGNDFEGEVPSGWNGTLWLNLANNRLEGLPLSLFNHDFHPHSGRFLDLSDNEFSGSVPTEVMDAKYMPHNGPSRWGGGINLCWNDWSIPESVQFHDWLRDHHVGGASFERCLSTERTGIDLALSGSWFDPERSGEGVIMHLLNEDRALLYWFTFDDEGGQRWLFEVGHVRDQAIDWPHLRQTRGRFGEGFVDNGESLPHEVRGSYRLDRLGMHEQLAERVYIDDLTNVCLAIYPPPLSCFGNARSDRLDHLQLTELAGTHCDNPSSFEQYSGVWHDPERDGEGFVIEVLPDNQVVIYWFTYKPDDSGEQAWIVGSGFIELVFILTAPPPGPHPVGIAEIETMHQPLGGVFGEDFDPAAVEFIEWGSLTLELIDDGSARVQWDSLLDGFGAGSYELEQVARPMLAKCED